MHFLLQTNKNVVDIKDDQYTESHKINNKEIHKITNKYLQHDLNSQTHISKNEDAEQLVGSNEIILSLRVDQIHNKDPI